ncbi:MAG: TonB-dependent receptor [Gemmatimonadota bacterium]|nr:TonB-dependent receptor [Gemmatimonadota bacterium]MDH3478565.1 TonB-dependent receptor [Gemmatimonadota bacterium]MDH3569345.1 TonB-dependent receptor [Gemmatimonadota bacterium]MDH5551243.1 TonB-dependent receptor [Gemmatimonadota bacterium]
MRVRAMWGWLVLRRLAFSSVLVVLLAIAAAEAVHAQGVRDITGTVLSFRDSSALPGVLVEIPTLGRAVVTDSSGAFDLRAVPRIRVRLTLNRIGVRPDSVWLEPDQDVLRVFLELAPIALPAITTEGQLQARTRFERQVQPSVVSIDRETITRLPAPFEADVVRVVQMLPGIVALNDYTVGFNVRGGEPDQNLTLLDGVTVFNPSHLGGLFSTFDTDAVENVDFFAGVFPAGYGGRLSSVLDVSVRPGRRDRFGVRGSISLLSSKVLAEGPIGGTGATWLVSGRRTYADVLAGLLSETSLPYYFADALGKVQVPLGERATLSLTGYWGRDVLDWTWTKARPGQDAVRLVADWGNHLFGIRYDQRLGPHRLTVEGGVTGFTAGAGLEPGLFAAENTARLVSGRARMLLAPHPAHEVQVGIGVEDYHLTYGAKSESFGTSFLESAFQPRVWSAFADEQWRVVPGFLVRPGVRVEAVEGPDVVNLAPRLSAKVFVTPALAVTAAVGRYHQALHSLRDQNLPWNVFDLWIGADSAIAVARSDQAVVGLEWWFGDAESVSIEAYRKTFTDIVDANLNEDPAVAGDETIPVSGDAWGFDVLLRRHWGRVTGWIAYSLTKAVRRANGTEYPAVHDRRHTVNVVVQAPGPLGSDLGVRWGYGSPLPFTPFVGEWDHRYYRAATHTFDDFEREPIASPVLNSERYPYYGRLDVTLRWEKRAWGGVLKPYVQIANALNRRNVFLYFYDFDDAPPTRSAISQLPLLPSFGMEFEF